MTLESLEAIKAEQKLIFEDDTYRNRTKHCPLCKQNIEDRQIALFKGMARALADVYQYCKQKAKYEFTRSEVKHLFKNESISARFGDWKLFGGLVYSPDKDAKKGNYGLHMARIEAFLRGDEAIPSIIKVNPLTGKITDKGRIKFVKAQDLPELTQLLDSDGKYKGHKLL